MSESNRPRVEAIVRQVLDEWKPFAWDRDAIHDLDLTDQERVILAELEYARTANDVAAILARVFASSFPDHHDQFTVHSCASVAALLYRELRAAQVLS